MSKLMPENIEETLKIIPNCPGCYLFLDIKGVVIYVGKAKNLKNRVASYFNRNLDNPKTNVLVKKISEIKYIVVDTEEDTLLLENNLIKEFSPRYNVLLKDDKTYPYIVVKNEPFPRVFQTRKIIKDGSKYFGPYTSVNSIKSLLDMFRKLYNIRTCNLNLSLNNIQKNKFNVCLEYHIKRCKGPCVGLQSQSDYNENIQEICEILKGNVSSLEKNIISNIDQLSTSLRFEEAQTLKEKFLVLRKFKEKSVVVSNINYNIDVFGYDEDDNSAYINYLSVVNGSIVQAFSFEYRKRIYELPSDLLGMAIFEMRKRFNSKSKEIIVPFLPSMSLNGATFVVPSRGDKKKLLTLSDKNVKQYKIDKLKKTEILNPEQRVVKLLETVKKDLCLKEIPWHIECFDNSNIQGTNSVAACIVFKKGKPSKKDYRIFLIKTVQGADDFASMSEIIHRRYSRLIKEGSELPQLIVIDGGKGQLNAAVKSLQKIDLYGKIAIIGIAKRLEEIYFPKDSIPLYLDKKTETLKLIQYLRDEAHRFGINFHRKKRSQSQIISELDNIKGIGLSSKTKLLSHFKSVKRIKESQSEEIIKIIGKSKADIIIKYFNII